LLKPLLKKNILDIFVTALTFQLPMFWLNAFAL
jgi:hypothetical protein